MNLQSRNHDFLLSARLAWQETQVNFKQFRVFILCLFLGLFVIAMVDSLARAADRGLRAEGKAILGGDFALRQIYQPITPRQLTDLESFGRVAQSIEMRAMIRTETGDSALTELKAIDFSYPLYGTLQLKYHGTAERSHAFQILGNMPEDRIGLFLDESLAARLAVDIGDTLRIGNQDFMLVDFILSEPDRAGGATFTVGPRTMMRQSDIEKTGLVRAGSQIYYHYKIALYDTINLQQAVDTLNEKWKDAGWRLLTYSNASPTIQSFLDRLELFFRFVGLSALLIGGVGIANAVNVILQRNRNQIVIMKSLGATQSFIFMNRMMLFLFAASFAFSAALFFSWLVPHFLIETFADKIPVPLIAGFSWAGAAQILFFTVTIVLLFSLLPLARALKTDASLLFRYDAATDDATAANSNEKKTFYVLGLLLFILCGYLIYSSPYHVLTTGFLIGAFFIFLFLRSLASILVTSLSWVKNHIKMDLSARLALQNMTRAGNQTFAILLSLGLSLTLFVAVLMIEHNIAYQIDKRIPDQAPRFFLIDIQPDQIENLRETLSKIESVSDLNFVPNLRGRIQAVNGTDAEDALVDKSKQWLLRGDRGFTYLRDKPEYSDLIAGEWWPEDYTGEPIVSIVEDVAQAFDIGIGDVITINILGRSFNARIANIRTVDWNTMTINYAVTFAPGTLEGAPQTFLATIRASAAHENTVLRALTDGFPNVSAIHVHEALETAASVMRQIALAMRFIAALALLVGLLVLTASIMGSLRSRRYEFVLLKVLGAPYDLSIRATLYEFFILGLLAAFIALTAGTIAAYLVVTSIMNFDWHFDITSAIAIVLINLTVVLGFAVFALRRVGTAQSADYLRNE